MSPDGTKWPPQRKLATGYAVAIAVLIIDLLITFWNLNSISRIWDALALSHDVVVGLDDVLSNLRDAETGQRGYLLTGDERYLEPYTKSHAVVATSIDRLRSLVANNGVRREHLNTAAEATSAKLSELEQTIRLRRESGFDAALAVVKTDRGRAYMDQVRSEIAAMGARENATRVRLRDGLQAALKGTTLTFTLTSVLALVLLFGIHLLSERSRGQLQRHAAWLSTTLRSMGDAVIATDGEGRVTFLNPVAETLTGWAREEASGKPLEHIFRITNQITGEAAENPVTRVLREGIVVGLANHTILTAKDGTSHPIDDTAAPITDDGGRIQGVVLVFHDVSERYAAEKSIRESTRARHTAEVALRQAEDTRLVLAAIVESSDDAIIGETLDGVITSWNQAAERILGYTAAEIVGKPDLHLDAAGPFRGHGPDPGAYPAGRARRPLRDPATHEGRAGHRRLAQHLSDPRCRRHDHRGSESRPGHHRAQARRGGAGATARRRRGGQGRGRSGQSHERRLPGHAFSRAAHPAQRHRRLGQDPPFRQGGCRGRGGGPLGHRPEFPGPDPDHRGPARHLPHHLGESAPRRPAAEPDRHHRSRPRHRAPGRQCQGDPHSQGARFPRRSRSPAMPHASSRSSGTCWPMPSSSRPRGARSRSCWSGSTRTSRSASSTPASGSIPNSCPTSSTASARPTASTTRRHAGLGLGLAIVKQLVEMHGGSIRAKSPGEGQGATFTLTLPITVVHPEQPEPQKVRPKESDATEDVCQDRALAGLKVLVVDDEPDARQLLRRALADCQAQVAVASSAAEALALIEKFRPDVIVCDIGMPEQDGYDLIHRVRANPATKDIPAAALTAFARPEDRKRSLLAGFQTHVAKPVDPAELTAVVASLAFRTGKGDQHQGGQP